MKPIRIQRKRTKGWRMPENTVYVGRGSVWGNPYYAHRGECPNCGTVKWFVQKTPLENSGKPYPINRIYDEIESAHDTKVDAIEEAVKRYRWHADRLDMANKKYNKDCYYKKDRLPVLSDIKGKNLSCWCKLSDSCHADILLELANQEEK